MIGRLWGSSSLKNISLSCSINNVITEKCPRFRAHQELTANTPTFRRSKRTCERAAQETAVKSVSRRVEELCAFLTSQQKSSTMHLLHRADARSRNGAAPGVQIRLFLSSTGKVPGTQVCDFKMTSASWGRAETWFSSTTFSWRK